MPKATSAASGPPPVQNPSVPLLGLLVFLTGGVILVLEIVGARLLSPVYGSSLNVWSSIITVTLLSLAVGYETGGRVADRFPAHDALQWLLAAAGLFILMVPSLREPVLGATSGLGLQAGALLASALLLAVPLVLLSAAGLVVARAATRSLDRLGRGVGRISFYSTLGSVAGALATGFFLIPSFPVSRIFYGAGAAVLAAISLVALDRRRRVGAATAIGVAVVAAFVLFMRPEPRARGVIHETESFYGAIKVTEAYPVRYLLLDGIHQSLWNVQTRENAGIYIHALEYGALAARGKHALVIGLGAGALPMILERHYGMTADSVDINAKVVSTAREYFDFATRGQAYVEDGRTFVRRCPDAAYDLIVLDTFNGDAIPYHLLTKEFFAELTRVLRPAGVVAVNTVGLFHGGTRVSSDIRAVASTLSTALPERKFFGLVDPDERRHDPALANVVLFASRQAIDPGPPGRWRPAARPILDSMLPQEIPAASVKGGLVLSDDFNPIDFLNAPTARVWRARILQLSS